MSGPLKHLSHHRQAVDLSTVTLPGHQHKESSMQNSSKQLIKILTVLQGFTKGLYIIGFDWPDVLLISWCTGVLKCYLPSSWTILFI